MAMPIADAASVLVATVLLVVQIRKLPRKEHHIHFSR